MTKNKRQYNRGMGSKHQTVKWGNLRYNRAKRSRPILTLASFGSTYFF
jgi:hypothetical protein